MGVCSRRGVVMLDSWFYKLPGRGLLEPAAQPPRVQASTLPYYNFKKTMATASTRRIYPEN
jgi:hypothetical protein